MRKFISYVLVAFLMIGVGGFMEEQNSQAEAKTMYESPARSEVRASHILVDTEAEALKIKADIEADKITFADAAMRYSKCPSKRNGGDLGFFGRGQMVKPFETAVFTLPLNTVSDPVRTQFGYHLIVVTAER